MKKTIYCTINEKGNHSFYVSVGNKSYFLFSQDYRVNVQRYFAGGIDVTSLAKAVKFPNRNVRRTAEKLPSYLSYIEKEYEVSIFNKTISRKSSKDKRREYMDKPFNWRKLCTAIA